MDAGVCSACQQHLGEISLEGMLGLFPRVRCNTCGLVNVLVDGSAPITAVPPPTHRSNETVSLDENPLYAHSEAEPEVPSYEEPSEVSAPPVFEQEAPAYEAEAPAYEAEAPAYEAEAPAYEAEVSPFASGEEAPSYEDNADYEQPVPMHGAIPDEGEYGHEVPDLPIESTRISIDPSEENKE